MPRDGSLMLVCTTEVTDLLHWIFCGGGTDESCLFCHWKAHPYFIAYVVWIQNSTPSPSCISSLCFGVSNTNREVGSCGSQGHSPGLLQSCTVKAKGISKNYIYIYKIHSNNTCLSHAHVHKAHALTHLTSVLLLVNYIRERCIWLTQSINVNMLHRVNTTL